MSLLVLHIDDDQVNRDYISRVLAHTGWDVVTAPDAQTGLTMATSQRPDLIITDIDLPDMSGIELIRHLRRDMHTTPPIIAMSADILHDRAALDAGAQVFLAKPVSIDILLDTIQRLESVPRFN
ncbi:MAG: response regulator, partial [Chloroflexi bacterium]